MLFPAFRRKPLEPEEVVSMSDPNHIAINSFRDAEEGVRASQLDRTQTPQSSPANDAIYNGPAQKSDGLTRLLLHKNTLVIER